MRISINGKFVRRIQLTGTEPEFHYGYGVFETIRTYHGELFELANHLKRLRQSAKTIHLTVTPSDSQLRHWLQHHCGRGKRRLKLIAAPHRVYILSTALQVDPNIYKQGVAVTTYPGKRLQPTVKGNAWVVEYLAYNQAQRKGYFDALLVDDQLAVPEAARGNLFLVRNGVLYTAEKNILNGVTRRVVITLARRSPYRLHYKTSHLKDILAADECFITKTTTGIVPVVRVNKTRIGTGKPGPITHYFMKTFDRYVEKTTSKTH